LFVAGLENFIGESEGKIGGRNIYFCFIFQNRTLSWAWKKATGNATSKLDRSY